MRPIKEMIAVMTAFDRGEQIQVAHGGRNTGWVVTDSPVWDWFNYDYRIKPKTFYINEYIEPDGSYSYGGAFTDEAEARSAASALQWGDRYVRTLKLEEVE